MSTNCPLCGSDQSSLFDQREFRGQPVTNRLCNTCGLVYQSPRMSDEELASYYEREYRLEYQGNEGPTTKDLATQRGRAESLISLTRPTLASVKRHLDIGCSAGILLKKFQKEYGCQSTGVEPGIAYRKVAQEKGLTVYPSLEALEQAGVARVDLISMAHVLEHLPEPVAYLEHLRTILLQPEGYLLIEVPNLYAHDSFEIAHLVSYSLHTLCQTLQQAGFSVIAKEAHGRPRSAVIPLYLTVLARPALQASARKPELMPEHQVAWKRNLGMLRRSLLTRLIPAKAWMNPEKANYPDL